MALRNTGASSKTELAGEDEGPAEAQITLAYMQVHQSNGDTLARVQLLASLKLFHPKRMFLYPHPQSSLSECNNPTGSHIAAVASTEFLKP